jgi:outer membrane protein
VICYEGGDFCGPHNDHHPEERHLRDGFVREEARVGERTTLDVLNAQQELVNARVALVTAQHDRVVASYSLLAAVGALSVQHLGLATPIYDPQVHYQQVRDAWFGLRTPDGK